MDQWGRVSRHRSTLGGDFRRVENIVLKTEQSEEGEEILEIRKKVKKNKKHGGHS